MENPLERQIPEDPIERIHDLARDIAYLAITGECTPHFRVTGEADQAQIKDEGLKNKLKPKWGDIPYYVHFLVGFGYLVRSEGQTEEDKGITFFDITPKAYDRLKTPIKPPKVFVSYQHDKSSALALLIEARLKLADSEINIFIDKNLKLGNPWHGELEAKVRECKYFICLLSPTSLASKWVRNEIKWALEEAKHGRLTIISICHNGYSFNNGLVDEVKQQEKYITPLVKQLEMYQCIKIELEAADKYEIEINKLLNRLGYSTY